MKWALINGGTDGIGRALMSHTIRTIRPRGKEVSGREHP
jgi:hypothetical protein